MIRIPGRSAYEARARWRFTLSGEGKFPWGTDGAENRLNPGTVRCFCLLFVVHLVQILLRTATLSLLAATQGWLAAVYLIGDFLLLVGYKAPRPQATN